MKAIYMNKKILMVLGCALILAGILGFAVPQLLGMHLGHAHNAIHLVSGCLALYFGWKGTSSAARTFSVIFGAVYALLGVIGFIVGGLHGMWVVVPNQLVLGVADHIVHLVVGGAFLVAGLCRTHALIPAHHGSP
jgi:hypothetical protein